jgi:hypothetical protein
MMPNPWESSSFSTQVHAELLGRSKSHAVARLIDVMLPPEQSSWQVRVHNKVEGFAQVLTMIREAALR